jgi:hypothetical protein
VLQESIRIADKVFDYDDMIYMPVLHDLVKPSGGLVIVDECQVQRKRLRERYRPHRDRVWNEREKVTLQK